MLLETRDKWEVTKLLNMLCFSFYLLIYMLSLHGDDVVGILPMFCMHFSLVVLFMLDQFAAFQVNEGVSIIWIQSLMHYSVFHIFAFPILINNEFVQFWPIIDTMMDFDPCRDDLAKTLIALHFNA